MKKNDYTILRSTFQKDLLKEHTSGLYDVLKTLRLHEKNNITEEQTQKILNAWLILDDIFSKTFEEEY